MTLRPLTPATQAELSRLLVILDDPLMVARAYGHTINRDHFTLSPRMFPSSLFKAFARRYWRSLVAVLNALVASDAYLAAPDYRRRRIVCEEQTRVARDVERSLSQTFLAAAVALPGDAGRYPQRWAS